MKPTSRIQTRTDPSFALLTDITPILIIYSMLSVNIFTATEARAQLSKLLDLVATGEEVIIIHKETGQKFIITPFKGKSSSKRKRKHIG